MGLDSRWRRRTRFGNQVLVWCALVETVVGIGQTFERLAGEGDDDDLPVHWATTVLHNISEVIPSSSPSLQKNEPLL